MHVISKRKDYYDGVVGATGIDKTIVYDRKEEVIPDEKWSARVWCPSGATGENVNYFIIGFCGKTYVGYKITTQTEEIDTSLEALGTFYKDHHEFVYDLDAFKKRYRMKDSFNAELYEGWYQMYDQKEDDELFIKYNIPVWVFDNSKEAKEKFIVSPILKDYGFYKLFDSFSAFQEIQAYVGGVLTNPETNMVEVEEPNRISQRGFDKMSFRKDTPPARKMKRKKWLRKQGQKKK